MKKVLIPLLLAGFIAACGNSDQNAQASATAEKATGMLTTVKWVDSVQTLGTIQEGQELHFSFVAQNTGSQPLVIESVLPSCGCTIANFPKDPIAPGAEAKITGTFDSKGKSGLQKKSLTVTANTEGSRQTTLRFEVEVEKDSK